MCTCFGGFKHCFTERFLIRCTEKSGSADLCVANVARAGVRLKITRRFGRVRGGKTCMLCVCGGEELSLPYDYQTFKSEMWTIRRKFA